MPASDIIIRLPETVANQIAAGEVIQRPASVVKELVENSVDAGATDIKIIIKDAGRTLIQVVDNGKGMSPGDARMAFERHATSKIKTSDDLFKLVTMGFRGEALASIAAVANVEMRTMRADDTVGTHIEIAGARVESQEPCATVPGTSIMVKNLFAYVPARRKYLSKDNVELSHIIHEFERLALVNTSIDFTLIHNDTTVHQLLRSSLRGRIGDLFGKTIERQIVPLQTETSIVKLSGFVGVPGFARRRGYHQFLFVNGRNMRHRYFQRAIASCFENLIAADAQPSYFINFEVDPERIDVNVHPQKHEIKFEDEAAIWQILVAAVKEALGKSNAIGAIDFDVNDAPDIPPFQPSTDIAAPADADDTSYNPFTADTTVPPISRFGDGQRQRRASLEEVRSALNIMEARNFTSPAPTRQLGLDELPDTDIKPVDDTRICDGTTPSYIQLGNRYIATPSRDGGLLLIDRHRAHVRVLFERFMSMVARGETASQRLIFPEAVSLRPDDDIMLGSICDSLDVLGFDLSPLGGGSWSVNAMPSALSAANPRETVEDIIMRVRQTGQQPGTSLYETIAASMARTAAVNVADRLTPEEIDMLVADLFATTSPNFTPDGLTILVSISADRINSWF